MRQPQCLESPREAFGQTLRDQQRSRAEQHDPERALLACVFVPEPLLLTDPVRATQRRLVGADVAHRQAQLIGDLLDKRRLADLARTGHHLQEPARLGEPLGKDGSLGALEGSLFRAHGIEYFYSML